VLNASDGFSYMAFRFRLQEWALLGSADDSEQITTSQIFVRRARVRFESVVWDPRLKVNVQLSFSRGDMDFENSQFPNVLRDYTVAWQATPRLQLMAGQTKLPGNRQRVVSSGEIQFPDRSIVNGAFTIDRDMGVWLTYHAPTAKLPFTARAAISGGEGRGAAMGESGLAYTGRVEVNPLGVFTGGGDYFEGDLMRERSPRVAVGITYSYNEDARRTGAQLGKFLGEPRDIGTTLADVLFKYNGFAASAEFARRATRDPITMVGAETRAVLAGDGITAQASYLTRSNFEFGVRMSLIEPDQELAGVYERQRQTSAVLTRYLRGHRVKWSTEVMRDDFTHLGTQAKRGAWGLRSSLDVGI
jgi:hypothetical protein